MARLLLTICFLFKVMAISVVLNVVATPQAYAASKCGGTDQKACPAIKRGPQCKGSLKKYKGYCRNWGRNGKKAWPAKRVGFRCNDGSIAPAPDGKCRKCGHKSGQPACETARKGPRCYRYMQEINGVCVALGGNGQMPYEGAGFDCKPGYNVGDNGRCAPCGDEDEVACEPLRKGDQCGSGLEKYKNYCRAWGQEGKQPWPKLRAGFRCEKGLAPTPGDDGDTCEPCGGAGQAACETMRQGSRCTAAYHQLNDDDVCEARGGEGQPIMTGLGFECRPGFNWEKNDDGDKICTRCGGLDQVLCEALREGKICGSGLTEELMSRRCVASPNHVENPITVENKSSEDVYVTIHWALDDENLWIVDEGEIPADSTKEFAIAGQYTCNPRKGESNGGGTDWGLSDLLDGEDPVDSCQGQHFQVMFWDSHGDRIAWAAENVAVGAFFYFATDFAIGKATGKFTGGILPIPGNGPDAVGLLAMELWNDIRDPDGTLAGYGVHGWAWNVPQEDGWVVYWGDEVSPDFGFTTTSTPDHTDLKHPCIRSADGHTWATAVNSDDEVEDGKAIHVPGMCDGVSTSSGYSQNSGDASRSAVKAASSGDGLSLRGDWKLNANGTSIDLGIVGQTATALDVRRGRSGDVVSYRSVGANEYREPGGARLKFVNASRGIWISADNSTTYQVQRN